jgi:hypothetical protein
MDCVSVATKNKLQWCKNLSSGRFYSKQCPDVDPFVGRRRGTDWGLMAVGMMMMMMTTIMNNMECPTSLLLALLPVLNRDS